MKKMKLLTPILGAVAISTAVGPIATSCSKQTTETNVIPTDYLDIVGYRLKGFKEDVDISKYDTLVIPDTVKYIDDNAFADVFVPGSKRAFIRTIVFPNTIKSIGKSAFKHCGIITTLDFSSWTIDNIRYCDIASEEGSKAFENWSDNGTIITNPDISKETKEELETRLYNAGLWKTWFAQESTDKVSPDSSWMEQNTETGLVNFQFQLNQDLPKDAENHIYGSVIYKNGTRGVFAIAPLDKREVQQIEENKFSFPVRLLNHSRIGDYAEFDISFGLLSKSAHDEELKPIWKQRLTGFKLNLTANVVDSVKVSADKSTIKTEDTLQLNATISPEDATNKEVTWISDHPEIASVDQNGLVTGVSTGTANITCTALGGLDVKDTFTINVEQGPYNLEYIETYGLPYGYISYDKESGQPIVISVEKGTNYTFKVKLVKTSAGKIFAPDNFGFRSTEWLAMNASSIVVRCDNKELTRGEDWQYIDGDEPRIEFNPSIVWKENNVVEITTSFASASTGYAYVGMEDNTLHFDGVNPNLLPIETEITGGNDGLYGIYEDGGSIVTANRYFELISFLGAWGPDNDWGKPAEIVWKDSEIALIIDFDDATAIDWNTITVLKYHDSTMALEINKDFTVTNLGNNRVKITLLHSSENFPEPTDFIEVWAYADKATSIKDAFMYADTDPESETVPIQCVLTFNHSYGCNFDVDPVPKTGSTFISGILYDDDGGQFEAGTYRFALYDISGLITYGDATLSDPIEQIPFNIDTTGITFKSKIILQVSKIA